MFGGDLVLLVWMYSVIFDVFRISEISVIVYLRIREFYVEGWEKFNGEGEGEDMGNLDLCLGSIRFMFNLDFLVSIVEIFEVGFVSMCWCSV